MPKPWRAVCPLLNTAKPIQEKRGANLAGRCCAFAAQTSAEFPLSFSRCGLEGKAEVQAACHSSCTTDLYTCIPPPCVPKCTGRKFSTSLRQCQVEIQMIIPKGTCLQRLPRCNSSLLQPRQQHGVVLIYPLLWCLCWACVHLASPRNQQNMLLLPADSMEHHAA